LPSGFLREPVSSLKRANLIWFTRVDFAPDLEQLQKMIDTIISCSQVKSVHSPTKLIQVNTKREYDLSFLKEKKVLLFSGIANHAYFKQTVKNLGAIVVFDKEFKDHFFYSRKDMKNIFAHYESASTELILTTEKDYYRLVNLCLDFNELYYLTIEISIKNDYDIFVNKMAAIL